MCGVNGILNFRKDLRLSDILKRMNNQVISRGPNGEGYFIKGNIGFSHRRLSIIDLETGNQPIFNEDKTIAVILNGEIYNFQELKKELLLKNHRFYTKSDTEILVHLYEEYGVNLLKKINGMFAFAIWDDKKNLLFLAKDRVGIKPLVYSQKNGNFIFASSIKSIVATGLISKQIDFEALNLYFSFGYIPAPWTIYQDIRKLKPGHFILIDKNGLVIKKYWDIEVKKPENISFFEAKEGLRNQLVDSVKKQMISDVPLGAFLSGGIDSSIITGLMSKISPKPIQTFTIGFPDKNLFDERLFAKKLALTFKTNHYEYQAGLKEILEIIPIVLDSLDEPFADQSILPTYLVSKITRKKVKVALSGDGGDELFAGYNKYLGEYFQQYFSFLPSPAKAILLNILPSSRSNLLMENLRKIKKFLRGLDKDQSRRHFNWMKIFSEEAKNNLLNREVDNLAALELIKKIQRDYFLEDDDKINRMLYTDLKFLLPYQMLTKIDQASMANSLEVRVPFLDHQVVELAFQMKGDYKMKGRKQKYILKETFKDLLPEFILKRPKHGFDVPIGEWFRDELKDIFFEVVSAQNVNHYGFLNYKVIENLFQIHFSKKEDYSNQIWSIFVFQWWLNKNNPKT